MAYTVRGRAVAMGCTAEIAESAEEEKILIVCYSFFALSVTCGE
jgi:hypothetical protein